MRGNNLQESFAFMNAPKGKEIQPPFDSKEIFRLAAQGIYLGTNSWKYRGWEGMIYQGGYSSEAQFQRVSLREYANSFPTVGVDFTYFAWPTVDMLGFLAESTPENFKLCVKATKRATWKNFPNIPVYGKWAGKANPEFLNIDHFKDLFLKPLQIIENRLAHLVFDFPELSEEDFPALAHFFKEIPFACAVEFRDPSLVNAKFYEFLQELNLSPILNLSEGMPSFEAQASLLSSDLPLVIKANVVGRTEEEANRLFQPFKEFKEPQLELQEHIGKFLNTCMEQKRKAFVLVSNRFEGSAPHSIGAILRAIHNNAKH